MLERMLELHYSLKIFYKFVRLPKVSASSKMNLVLPALLLVIFVGIQNVESQVKSNATVSNKNVTKAVPKSNSTAKGTTLRPKNTTISISNKSNSTKPKNNTAPAFKNGNTSMPPNVTTTKTKTNSTNNNFNDWREKHKKNYDSTAKMTKAQTNFNSNVAKVNKHNANKTAHFKMSTNVNADLSLDDIKKTRTGFKPPKKPGPVKSSKKNMFFRSTLGKKKKAFTPMNLKSTAKNIKFKASAPTVLDYSR